MGKDNLLNTVENLENISDIQEVKDKLDQKLVEELKPIERPKRGRPKKENTIGEGVSPQQGIINNPQAALLLSKIDLKPLLAKTIEIPFAIVADRTKFKGFLLEPEYSENLATQVDTVLKIYFENLNPKHLALISLSISLAGICYSKYNAYNESKKENYNTES